MDIIGSILNESMIDNVLNEAYFGKTKELLEMENTLHEFRQKYMKQYNRIKNTGINSDPLIQKFNRQMENTFGFGVFCLHIHNVRQINASTCPIDVQTDYKKKDQNLANALTYKFDKSKNFATAVNIYSGLLMNPKFTSEEILAIILHEIGHNFYSAISTDGAVRAPLSRAKACNDTTFDVIEFLNKYLNSNPNTQSYRQWVLGVETELRNKGNKWVTFVDAAREVKTTLKNVGATIHNWFRVCTLNIVYDVRVLLAYFNPLTLPYTIKAIKSGKDKNVNNSEARRNERVADNFVSMYGYGPALSSAFAKFEDKEMDSSTVALKFVDHIPVIGQIFHALELPGYMLCGLFDEHPTDLDRAKDQVALLKREASKADLDPKMKERILQDVKEIEASITKITDTSKKLNPYIAKKYWNAYLDSCTENDPKEQEKRFQSYDDNYEAATGKPKNKK